MHPAPRTAPLPDPDATRVVRPRRPRTRFYLTVGCLSVIAGLLLGVGGFAGVRTLQGGTPAAGDATPGADSGTAPDGAPSSGPAAAPDDEESGTGAVTTPEAPPTVLEQAPSGRDAAIPFASTVPLHSSVLEGEVEVTFTAMDWDATAEILAANSLTQEPAEGAKYLLLSLEGIYRGTSPVDRTQGWMRATYVAEDGTEHPRVHRVTPGFDDLIEQQGVTPEEPFLAEIPFEVPEQVSGGGHVVLHDTGQPLEEGTWVELD